jgi:hypothetical protein
MNIAARPAAAAYDIQDPSYMTGAERALVEPLITAAKRRDRKRSGDLREELNTIS